MHMPALLRDMCEPSMHKEGLHWHSRIVIVLPAWFCAQLCPHQTFMRARYFQLHFP